MGLVVNINRNISFYFRSFQRKTNDKIFKKIHKTLFWVHFGPLLPEFQQKWIFPEKRAISVFSYSNSLPSWQKSEKPNEKNAKLMDGQTDRQTDRQRWFYRMLRRMGVQQGGPIYSCKTYTYALNTNTLKKIRTNANTFKIYKYNFLLSSMYKKTIKSYYIIWSNNITFNMDPRCKN